MSEIHIDNVSKTFDDGVTYSVRNLTLSIKKGTIFGFLGPNGAGKTTTMKMLVGLAKPSEGEIKVLGALPDDMEMKSRIGFMPEAPTFYAHLSGEEFLVLVASLFSLSDTDEKVKEVLEKVGLFEARKRKIKTYSKGMQQRLGLAQAIINNPDILFLDEPLDGLDPLGRAEIKKIMLALKAKKKTIFLNTHILGDVEEICDMVGIIDKGSLIALDTPKNLSKGYKDLEAAFVAIVNNSRQ